MMRELDTRARARVEGCAMITHEARTRAPRTSEVAEDAAPAAAPRRVTDFTSDRALTSSAMRDVWRKGKCALGRFSIFNSLFRDDRPPHFLRASTCCSASIPAETMSRPGRPGKGGSSSGVAPVNFGKLYTFASPLDKGMVVISCITAMASGAILVRTTALGARGSRRVAQTAATQLICP